MGLPSARTWVMYCIVSSPARVEMHKRSRVIGPMAAGSDFGFRPRSLRGEGKVIGSSEQVHVVDALAMIGDEGRDSLR